MVNGNLTSDNIQSIVVTGDKFTVVDGFIKNAMIDTVSADKVNTGTLNTNNVSIQSEDGSMLINGTTQQFKDKNGKVRIQIGKDATGDFTFALFSQDGQGILIDEAGIKAGAVPDGLIVNDMVADNANISGNKLDISSVITSINNNTTSIKSSAIKFDDTGQTLQIAFNELKTKVNTIEEVAIEGDLSSVIEQVTSNTTNIGVMQGQISSLISNTSITKENGQVVQLKDEYMSTQQTVNGLTSKVGSLETNYKATLKSSSPQYYISTSSTSLSGGSWSDSSPTWTTGKYIWQRMKYTYTDNSVKYSTAVCIQGAKGEQGDQGPQGVPGNNGKDGKPTYTWIKYADDANGNGISNDPTGKKYIGFAYNKTTATESTNASDYTWSLIKGDKGDTGVQGPKGTDGKTTYTWIKYSDNADGTGLYDTPKSTTKYIGIATNKTTATESTNKADYVWSQFKGDKGDKGDQGLRGLQGEKGDQGIQGPQGPAGKDGKTTYFHIKYSANANGNPMSETPNTYIGTYVDYTATDSTDYTKYTWSRFQGLQGAKGDQGIPGKNGNNGQTYYLHIKYSNDGGKTFTSNNGENPGAYIGVYTDTTAADSTSVSKYTWSKVKGDKGDTGAKGDKGATGEKGQSLTKSTPQWYASTSKTSQTGGSWVESMPTIDASHYLWLRYKLDWENPTATTYTTPTLEQIAENIKDVSAKQSEFQQDLNGFKTTVSKTYATKAALNTVDGKFANYSTTSAMNSAIQQKANEITSSVSQTYATKTSLKATDDKFANYSTTSQMNTAIKQKSDAILSTVSNNYTTKADFNNLTLGGTNLVANSAPQSTSGWSPSTGWVASLVDCSTAPYGKAIRVTNNSGTSGAVHKPPIDHTKCVNGEYYTISAWIRASKSCTMSFVNEMMTSGNRINITTSWKYYTFTSKINTGAQYHSDTFYVTTETISSGMWLEIHSLKFEKGTKPSSWSPAPQDIDSAISTVDGKFANYSTTSQMNSAINQKANEITSTVSQTYATKASVTDISNNLKNNYSTTSAMNSAINQKANEITSSVSQTYATKTALKSTDNKFANYSTTSAMNSAINQKANEITSSVSQTYATKSEFNNLNVGGRNFVINSGFKGTVPNTQTIPYWGYWGNVVVYSGQGNAGHNDVNTLFLQNNTTTGGGIYQDIPSTKIPKNTQITISYDMRRESNVIGSYTSLEFYDTNSNRIDVMQLSDSVGHIVRTVTTSNTNYSIMRFVIGHQGSNSEVGQYLVYIGNIKIEKGNKATDWSPAPEDIDNKFANYPTTTQMESKINQTAQGINTEVSKKLNSADLSSRIQQSANDIKIGFNKITNFMTIDPKNGLKVNHTDGSYTRISAGGLELYQASTGYRYKCLVTTGYFSIKGKGTSVITLPAQFDDVSEWDIDFFFTIETNWGAASSAVDKTCIYEMYANDIFQIGMTKDSNGHWTKKVDYSLIDVCVKAGGSMQVGDRGDMFGFVHWIAFA